MSDSGRLLLKGLKETAGSPGPELKLVVGQPAIAVLRPVATRPDRINARDVSYLTQWRNRFVTSFLTEFNATDTQTANWLSRIVGPNDGKILFMVDDMAGNTFAYMGLDFISWEEMSGEADAIVRGGDAPPGTMKVALTALLDWASGSLGLRHLGVRVRSDNSALEFYRKIGFVEQSRTPLVRHTEQNMIRWSPATPDQAGEIELVHMAWRPAASTPSLAPREA